MQRRHVRALGCAHRPRVLVSTSRSTAWTHGCRRHRVGRPGSCSVGDGGRRLHAPAAAADLGERRHRPYSSRDRLATEASASEFADRRVSAATPTCSSPYPSRRWREEACTERVSRGLGRHDPPVAAPRSRPYARGSPQDPHRRRPCLLPPRRCREPGNWVSWVAGTWARRPRACAT